MKRIITNKKILPQDILKIFSLFLAFVWFWDSIWRLWDRELYLFYYSLMYVFAFCALYCIADTWKNHIVWNKSDFKALEKYLRLQLNQRKSKGNIELYMELLLVDLLLGKYDEYQEEKKKLGNLDNYLTEIQKLQLRILHIDYLISVNEITYLQEELEKAEKELEESCIIRDKAKRKIREQIKLRRYLAEERWEEILELIKGTSRNLKRGGLLEQVTMAYIRGKCYYKLGRYKEAYAELQFVIKWGNNIRYVAMANDMIEKIPDKWLYEKEYCKRVEFAGHGAGRKLIFLIANCVMVLLLGIVSYYSSYGVSMEEVYSKRYLCSEDEPVIFYNKQIGDYEIAVLGEGKNTSYCVFQKREDSNYKIKTIHRVENYAEETLFKVKISESQKEDVLIFWTKQEVKGVITGFYKNNEDFLEGDMECVGLSYSPIVENVMVNGSPICVEQIVGIDGIQSYLWRVKVNLEEDIQVKYIEK